MQAVPMDSLGGAIQLIAFGGLGLVDLVATERKLIGVKLDVAGMVGRAGGLEGTINLFQADNGTTERVAVLTVDLMDGQGVCGVVPDREEGRFGGGYVERAGGNNTIASGRVGLGQCIGDTGL